MLARVPKSRDKPRKRSSVSAETRERILAGAAQAFGRLGYAKVRVEDILLAARVSRPTFYKVYRTKDEVFRALSERHHREIRKRIERAIDGAPDPIAQLDAVIDAFLRWRAGLGAVGRVLDLEARTPGTSIARHRQATLRAMTQLTAERMKAAGRPTTDAVLITALIAAMESVADSLLIAQEVDEATLARAKQNALRIVAGALAGPGDPVPPLPSGAKAS